MNAVDFDDLMLLAVRGLEENPDLRKSWQRHFRYIMVDEFQDTNHLQMTLLRLIVGKERNICVCGRWTTSRFTDGAGRTSPTFSISNAFLKAPKS